MFNDYSIVLQKAPYWHAIWPISEAEMAYIEPQNRLYRMVKWALSESETDFSGLRYGVYEKPICPEPASDMSDLTFLHISFAKIFCQNLVKKNRKLVFKPKSVIKI